MSAVLALVLRAASTEAVRAPDSVAGAGALRACLRVPPRSWSSAAEGAGALRPEASAGTAAPAVISWPILAGPSPRAEAVVGEARRPQVAPAAPEVSAPAPTES